jgi:RNA polymerase-binding transcription factor DksA
MSHATIMQTDLGASLVEHRLISLAAVDAAFEPFRQGRYGNCEDSGNEIPRG